jgi:hypothetical protein
LCTRYCDKNGKHFEKRQVNSFKGNLIFGSKNAFKGHLLSRRDDLISLAYLLIYIVDGDLEFMKGHCESGDERMSSNSDEFISIGKAKLNMTPKDICPSPESRELLPFVEEIYNLRFDEEPNYNKLSFLLVKILMNSNQVPDDQYEWNQHLFMKNLKLNPLLPIKLDESYNGGNNSSMMLDGHETGFDKGKNSGNNSFKNADNPNKIQPAQHKSIGLDDPLNCQSNDEVDIMGSYSAY